ncbi:hypothetical protein [Aeromonas hydrophila]|uniref:hypothetical protein n=1 Tax=Aeromonas hydrophila TaxID=644 RepID=UPI00214EF944|nr:hypothetical protein [Aeromonas hydrophila]MCR3951022.1 hypothetical protein [Aeromonas hydrophila]
MFESVKLSFYRIDECGYYNYGKEDPAFGTASQILKDIQKWSLDKSIENTKLYEPADGSNYLSTYLLNISKYKDYWLLTTWNETPTTEAGVPSVLKTSKVSAPGVIINDIKADSIPGYATYFWFLPDESMFASVRFRNRTLTGQPQMRKYIESALSFISSCVVLATKAEADGTHKILGYRDPSLGSTDLPKPQPQPRFNTSLAQKAGNRELIRQKANEISKIYRKETLQLKHMDKREWWQSALQRFGITAGSDYNRTDDVNIKYEISPESLNLPIVNKIIKSWDDSEDTRSEWDDYGFGFVGSSTTPHWLSHSTLKASVELDVIWDNDEVINAENLLKQLNKRKALILKQISER